MSERFSSFPLARFFGMKAFSFSSYHLIVYGRARLAMEGKSVVPMSIPVSVYGYLGLLRLAWVRPVATTGTIFFFEWLFFPYFAEIVTERPTSPTQPRFVFRLVAKKNSKRKFFSDRFLFKACLVIASIFDFR